MRQTNGKPYSNRVKGVNFCMKPVVRIKTLGSIFIWITLGIVEVS